MDPSNNNQVPERFLSGVRMYGTEERGMFLILSADLPPAKFGDNPGLHHILTLDMEHPVMKSGVQISAEIQQRMAMAIENSKPFKDGRVFYVKSPEELKEESKRKEQQKFREDLIRQLSSGVVKLDLERDMDGLCELADKIGAVYLDKNGKRSMKHAIQKNIRDALGIMEAETITESQEKKPGGQKKGVKLNAKNVKRVEKSPHENL
jgi:hypothetical protein